MTREEAIAILRNEKEHTPYYKRKVALGKAIKALEQQPCEDCISRQAVLDMLENINAETEGVGFYYEHYVAYIKNLPPVTPQQEPILDKIRAEIQKLRGCSCSCSDGIIDDVEDILDKHKAESEALNEKRIN